MNDTVSVRLSAEVRRVFLEKSAKYGGTSYVLRELVQAFNDGRLSITPPPYKLENLK